MDGRPVLAGAAAGVRVPDDPRHSPVHPPAAARRVRSVRSKRGRPGRAARRPRSAGKTLGGDRSRARRIRGRAAGGRRRRVRAAPAPSRVRRLPGGAGAAALELDRHGPAIAGRPPPRPRAAGSASPAARLGRHAAHHPAMTFRTRILIGFGVVVLVPLALFGVRVRTAMATRLTDEYERRVATLVAVIRTHLTRDGAAIARRLEALTEAIAADNRFREAVRLPTAPVPAAASPAAFVREFSLPFVLERDSSAVLRPARIVVSHSLGSLAALRRGVDVAFLAAVLLAGAIALLLGGWLSLRISRPLTALAHKTAQIDMDRLDVRSEEHTSELQSPDHLVCR